MEQQCELATPPRLRPLTRFGGTWRTGKLTPVLAAAHAGSQAWRSFSLLASCCKSWCVPELRSSFLCCGLGSPAASASLHTVWSLCFQGCALYNNWWPMLSGACAIPRSVFELVSSSVSYMYVFTLLCSVGMGGAALMYVLVPMPCLFFGGGSSTDFISVGGDSEYVSACLVFSCYHSSL